MEKIALFGAAGAIGHSIAGALRKEGQAYRVVGRNRAALQAAFGSDALAEIATWDPDDSASIREAARGVDTLIYLVGVAYNQFQLHPILMTKTLDGAVSEGVRQIVLVGTVYPYGMPQTTPVTENHPRAPHTFKGRMRKEQEDVLLDADAAGKIRATILRLPDFYGPRVERSFLHSLFEAAARNGTANLLGPIDTLHEFVFVPDVGPVVLALAKRAEAYGHWWHFAGPGSVTQREIAERVFAMAGLKPKMRVAGKNTLRILGLFNPFMRELVEMNYLFTSPLLMDDSALQRLLGGVRKTPYEEGFRLSLEAARAGVQSAL
ncbi:MAG: NAD-dependent epimerase/dehydratase family protein [Acidobacteriaceae bacterium]|nr:NAD-dependent epimerase/dehydratase family protein [Acidobacteriaceae bacterium]